MHGNAIGMDAVWMIGKNVLLDQFKVFQDGISFRAKKKALPDCSKQG